MKIHLREHLAYLRKAACFYEEAAEKIDTSRQAASKWEAGVSQSERYHTKSTLAFAEPIQPEG